jgi:hypothetical protein
MNRILAICAAAALLLASAACPADEVFPVVHKEPIAIQVLDGKAGSPQAGVPVLLTGGYDRRDLAERQWHEESVTDAEGKVRLSDALRNLPLLRVEVLKRHSCGPVMAAWSVERIRRDGMGTPNLCGGATVVDAGGVFTVFVKGKKPAAVSVAAISGPAAQPVGLPGSLELSGSPAKTALQVAITEASAAVNVQPHDMADEAKGEPESSPVPESAPIPFPEPLSDFTMLATPRVDAAWQTGSSSDSGSPARATHARVLIRPVTAAPAKKATDAVKPAQSRADMPGGKPSAAHAAATAAGTPLAEQPVARLKRASQSGERAEALRQAKFSHSGYSAENRAAEAHARGLALAAARAAGRLMDSTGNDPSLWLSHAGLHGSNSSSASSRAVLPVAAPVLTLAPAAAPTRSNAPGEDAGDTECAPAAN